MPCEEISIDARISSLGCFSRTFITSTFHCRCCNYGLVKLSSHAVLALVQAVIRQPSLDLSNNRSFCLIQIDIHRAASPS